MSTTIRKKVRVEGGAFGKLKSLGPELMAAIDTRLVAGETGKDIALWIQNDLGRLTDMKLPTLKKSLERYRASELRQKTIERIANVQRHQSTTQLVQRLNAMDELEEMAMIQRGRVEKLLVREAELPGGILLKDTSNEIRLLKDMLVDLGRVQLETGVLARATKTVKGQMVGANGEMHNFEWTEEQEKMFQTIEHLAAHAAEDA